MRNAFKRTKPDIDGRPTAMNTSSMMTKDIYTKIFYPSQPLLRIGMFTTKSMIKREMIHLRNIYNITEFNTIRP